MNNVHKSRLWLQHVDTEDSNVTRLRLQPDFIDHENISLHFTDLQGLIGVYHAM